MRNTKTIWSGAADLLKSRGQPLPYRFKNEASEAKKKWKLAEYYAIHITQDTCVGTNSDSRDERYWIEPDVGTANTGQKTAKSDSISDKIFYR